MAEEVVDVFTVIGLTVVGTLALTAQALGPRAAAWGRRSAGDSCVGAVGADIAAGAEAVASPLPLVAPSRARFGNASAIAAAATAPLEPSLVEPRPRPRPTAPARRPVAGARPANRPAPRLA